MLKRSTYLLNVLAGFVVVLASATATAASFGSGITYTGRIVKDTEPINTGIVRFYVWVQNQNGCDLYAEQRDIDMTGSDGTYAFEIGGTGAMVSSFPHSAFGVANLSDVFDNNKTTADLDTSKTGCLTFTPASDEGRVLKIQILPPGEAVAQALPSLTIAPVPMAYQAFNATKVQGYGTGDLLKVDPAYTAKTTANNPLTAAQYEEFWKLILGTSTTYLKTIPTLGGDISGTLPAVTVDKIKGVAVTAPTTGDTGKVLTYNGTGLVWQTGGGGGSGITSLNGLTGATQSFVIGSSGTDVTISSSGTDHTINVPTASAANRGVLSSADWTAFNAKLSGSLTSGQVWVGNSGNAAQARTLSGDIASVSDVGLVTVNKTASGQASYILALDGSGVANAYGVGIKGATSGSVVLQANTTTTNYSLTLPAAAPGASQILQSDASGILSWVSNGASVNNAATLADGQIWIGNGSNVAVSRTLSGDATISNAGLLTLKNTGTVGTYFKVVTDAQGRVASGSALLSSDVTSALGYTPSSGNAFVQSGNSFAATAVLGTSDNNDLKIKTNNTDRLTILKTGEVGIGTTSPSTALHIEQTTTGDAVVAMMNPSATSSTSARAGVAVGGSLFGAGGGIYYYGPNWANGTYATPNTVVLSSNNAATNGVQIAAYENTAPITFRTAGNSGSEKMRISAAGQVGIGGTPSYILDIGASTDAVRLPVGNTSQRPTDAAGLIRYNSTNSNLEFNNGSAWTALASGGGSGYVNGGNSFAGNATIGLNDAYNLGFKTNNTTQMTLTSAGSLGINTASPFGKFQVNGGTAGAVVGTTDFAAGTGGSALILRTTVNTGNASGEISAYDSGGSGYANLILNSLGGKVGIGNISPAVSLDIGTRTDAIRLPNGATGDRPANAAGLIRYNTTNGNVEFNDGSSWTALVSSGGSTMSDSLAAGKIWVGNASGIAEAFTLSGDVSSVSNTGSVVVNKTTTAQSNMILSLDGSGVGNVKGIGFVNTGTVTLSAATASATYGLKLPAATPAANQVLESDASGNLSWVTPMTSSTGYVNGGNTFAGNATLGLNDAYNLGFKTNNTTQMTLTSAGRLGLGIAAPTVSLDLSSKTDAVRLPVGNTSQQPSNATGLIRYNTTNSAVEFNNGSTWATLSSSVSGFANGGNSFGAGATIGTNDNYDLNFETNNNTRMNISNSGNVGIGTSAGYANLAIAKGTAPTTPTTANEYLHLGATEQNSNSYRIIGFGYKSSEAYSPAFMGFIETSTSGSSRGDLVFATRSSTSDVIPTEIMRITSGGNVAIGSNSAVSLDVSSRTDAIRVPVGNTSQRPSNATGLIRYNSTVGGMEYNNGSAWNTISSSSTAFVNGGNAFAGNASVGTTDSYPLYIKTNNTTAITVNANQNISLAGDLTFGANGTISRVGNWDLSTDSTLRVQRLKAGDTSSGATTLVDIASTDLSIVPLKITGASGQNNNYLQISNNSGGSVLTVDKNSALEVTGPMLSTPSTITGATVNLQLSNTIAISAIGGSTITLQNMKHGGSYTLLVSDTTARTYTFSGCNTSKFKPANTATISGTSSMYNIITVYNGSTYDCWITWASGYQ